MAMLHRSIFKIFLILVSNPDVSLNPVLLKHQSKMPWMRVKTAIIKYLEIAFTLFNKTENLMNSERRIDDNVIKQVFNPLSGGINCRLQKQFMQGIILAKVGLYDI